MTPRPRILLLGPTPGPLAAWTAGADVVPAADPGTPSTGCKRVASPPFWPTPRPWPAGSMASAAMKSFSITSPRGRCSRSCWNRHLGQSRPAQPVPTRPDRPIVSGCAWSAIGRVDDPDPLGTARRNQQSVTFRLHRPGSLERPYLDVTVRPAIAPSGKWNSWWRSPGTSRPKWSNSATRRAAPSRT